MLIAALLLPAVKQHDIRNDAFDKIGTGVGAELAQTELKEIGGFCFFRNWYAYSFER